MSQQYKDQNNDKPNRNMKEVKKDRVDAGKDSNTDKNKESGCGC